MIRTPRRVSVEKALIEFGNRHHTPYPEHRRLWNESMMKATAASMDDIEAKLFDDQ